MVKCDKMKDIEGMHSDKPKKHLQPKAKNAHIAQVNKENQPRRSSADDRFEEVFSSVMGLFRPMAVRGVLQDKNMKTPSVCDAGQKFTDYHMNEFSGMKMKKISRKDCGCVPAAGVMPSLSVGCQTDTRALVDYGCQTKEVVLSISGVSVGCQTEVPLSYNLDWHKPTVTVCVPLPRSYGHGNTPGKEKKIRRRSSSWSSRNHHSRRSRSRSRSRYRSRSRSRIHGRSDRKHRSRALSHKYSSHRSKHGRHSRSISR